MVTSATSSSAASAASNSGFDVNAIVTGLMSIERRPINTLNTRVSGYQAQLSALGLIKSNVASFQAAVQALGSSSSSSLNTFQSVSSDPGVFSAIADGTALAGNYSLSVSSLAQAQNLVATGQVSSTAAIGNGTATTVTFDFGTISGGTLAAGAYSGATYTSNGAATKSITIDSTNNTLAGIRDAINAANIGMTASIVNDGSSAPNRLTLTSNSTGVSTSVKITTTGGDGTINALLANDPAGVQHLNQTVAAQNANFIVNGIAITNASNTVSNAIQGVTLSLSKTTATPVTLNVSRDTTAVSKAVAGFVTAYNSLYVALKNSSDYKSLSALHGDATLRTLQTQMRSIAGSSVSGGTYANMFDAGISFTADGTMQLDNTKLNSTVNSNFNDVAALFNSATGYATRFDQLAKTTLAVDGTLATHSNGINKSISNINNQITTLETRMVGIEKRLRAQYSSLNVMLSQMGTTSAYLAQQLPRL